MTIGDDEEEEGEEVEESEEQGEENLFMVSVQGESIIFLRPPGARLSKERALNLAAYIVALASHDDDEWEALLEKVRNT